jgi:hypothetical protein
LDKSLILCPTNKSVFATHNFLIGGWVNQLTFDGLTDLWVK